RKRGIQSGEVPFIVDAEGAAVEVGRADDAPDAVDDQNFRVDHRRLVFVDGRAGLEDLAVASSARAAGEEVIGVLAGSDDDHLDAALDGAADLFFGGAVGHEVGGDDVDGLLRGGQ